MSRLRSLFIGLALTAGFLSACGSETDQTSDSTATPVPTPSDETAEPTQPAEPTPSIEPGEPTPSDETAEPTQPAEPTPSIEPGDQPVSIVEEIDPMDTVQGGNVGRVYDGDDYPPELGGLVETIVADAAGRLGITSNDLDVVAVAEVVWSDASLGCPAPGLVYAQVVTDGLRVVVQANNLSLDYRASGVDTWFLCSQAVTADKSSAGLYEITEDGVVQLEPPVYDESAPTEGTNPPDE